METGDLVVREAAAGDGEILAELRTLMLSSIFAEQIDEEDERRVNLEYFRGWDGRNPYCLIAEEDGRVAGTIACSFFPHFPSSRNPSGKLALVHNLCVFEEFRGRGIGRNLVRAVLTECRRRQVGRVNLYASDMGRGIYEAFGFREERPFCPEMRLHQAELMSLDL